SPASPFYSGPSTASPPGRAGLRPLPLTALDPDFHLTDRDFDRVRRLIHARAGISLGAQKRQMVYSRLTRRLRELGQVAFTPYLDRLEADSEDREWQAFINALTTNLTAFFRE